VLDGLFID